MLLSSASNRLTVSSVQIEQQQIFEPSPQVLPDSPHSPNIISADSVGQPTLHVINVHLPVSAMLVSLTLVFVITPSWQIEVFSFLLRVPLHE